MTARWGYMMVKSGCRKDLLVNMKVKLGCMMDLLGCKMAKLDCTMVKSVNSPDYLVNMVLDCAVNILDSVV